MLDKVEPIPQAAAIRIIEEDLGKPLEELFSVFDPEAIGSASIACVYQAVLHDGRKVAVKVRRPKVDLLFAADLRALDWWVNLFEWTTITRPGLSTGLRFDIREMLKEELDFRQEIRYQELFRRYAKKDGQDYVTAPLVYSELCGTRVIVEEFVSGVWLWELLAAVDHNDTQFLSALELRGIRPKKVAKRLLRTSYWCTQEALFFHADPHPANVIVMEDSKLVLIDFGACGPTSHKVRRLQEEIYYWFRKGDVSTAAQRALTLLEPLPFVDVDELPKKTESVWWKRLYALRAKSSPWWERTTAGLWLALLDAVRDYQIPVNLDTLRTMRASLLYDTLAARLWPKVDDGVFWEYMKDARKRRARRVQKQAASIVREGVGRELALQVDDLATLGYRLKSRLEHLIESRPPHFFQLASKTSFVFSTLISLVSRTTLLTAGAAAVLYFVRRHWGLDPDLTQCVFTVLLHPAYLLVIGLSLLLFVRRIQFRLGDRDPERD
jgi:predicted unusual protein kinase regulating ubiquinone biosynthesis (AarF/ABC1/UbiB family)